MKASRYLYFVLFCSSIFEISVAQKNLAEFNLITGGNGVSIGKITGITQDKRGYMWFVDQGSSCLIKYDGLRMKTFRNNPSDTNSLNSAGFECIAADSTGGIWVDAIGGVDRFDPNTEKFIHYRFPGEKLDGAQLDGAQVILVDHSGIVWVGTANGLYRLEQATGKFTHYQKKPDDPHSLSCNMVRSLYEDRQGVLWIGTGLPFDTLKEGGLNKLDQATGKFTRYLHDPANPHSLINNKIRAIFEDSRGVFWVGTQGDGLHIMDRKNGTFTRLSNDPRFPDKLSRPPVRFGYDHITFITEDLSGKIWIGTYTEGLVTFDPFTNEVTRYKSDISRKGGFTDSTAWCAFNSHGGPLWIAVEGSNLFRVDPIGKVVRSISTTHQVNGFLEARNGDLWVSTWGSGLLKFDSHYNLIRQFRHDPSNPFSILENRAGLLYQSKADTILVGTFSGLQKFNTVTEKFFPFQTSPEFKDSLDVGFVTIIEDRSGVFWFTRWGWGLISYNPKTASFKHYLMDENDSGSLRSNKLNSVLEDKSGWIWVSGEHGINCLNRQTGKFKHYLSDIFVAYLYEDSHDRLWAGSARGLLLYNRAEDLFESYFDVQSGINASPAGSIIEDSEKNLWLAVHPAIVKLNAVNNERFIYGSSFGIAPNSVALFVSPFKNAKGDLFFGHGSGFYTFNPNELPTATGSAIIITDLVINNRRLLPGNSDILKGPVEEISELGLEYNQNNVVFSFAAVDYANAEAIRYWTMLEGYDNTWREAGTEKSSYYFSVPTGKYVYHIRAFNTDGSITEKTIAIRIHPPWWFTWWAFSLYGLILIAVIWTVVKFRTKALKKEKVFLETKVTERTKELKEEKELVEKTLSELKSTQAQLIQSEKMASLGELTAGIAHEIQNPLNFVNNFSEVNRELIDEMKEELATGNPQLANEIADNIKLNLEKINHHGKRADAIVKGMLQHSRASTGKKEPTDINALAEEYLRLAYHGLRAKDKSFNATTKTDFDKSVGKINVVPQDIGRVVLNLINNAFYAVGEKKKQMGDARPPARSGTDGDDPVGRGYEPTVTVSTGTLNGKVEIKVADNGNGIPQKVMDKIFQPFFTTKPTGEGTGLGLSLAYDIITKGHGGEIKVTTKENEGTEFTIALPV